MRTITTDVVIVGAGPTGLFQAFELGLHGYQSVLVDSLLDIGGQCAEVHCDEPIYGIPTVLETNAKTIVNDLWQQALVFDPKFILGEQVKQITKLNDTCFELTTNKNTLVMAKSVVIAGGKGAFAPIKLQFSNIEQFENRQVFYQISDLTQFKNKSVVVTGDTDTAFHWALTLEKITNHVILVHENTDFRASPELIEKVMDSCDQLKMQFICGDISQVNHDNVDLTGVTITTPQGSRQEVSLDALLVFKGMAPQAETHKEWSLAMNNSQIQVDITTNQSSETGIYAVGDACYYLGKRSRMLSGFHEASVAAQSIADELTKTEQLNAVHTTYNNVEMRHLNSSFPLTNAKV